MLNLVINKKQTPIEIALDIDESGHTTAKKLYSWLELDKSSYSKWVRTNIIDNPYAENGVEYSELTPKTYEQGGRPSVDYLLSATFAKKLAMSSRSSKGEETRDYFIKVEQALVKTVQKEEKSLTPAEMFLHNAQIMVEHEKRLASVEEKQEELASDVKDIEDRLTAAEIKVNPVIGMDYYTITGYIALMKLKVNPDDYSRLGKAASTLSRKRGYPIGHAPSPVYGSVGCYHTDILSEAFELYFSSLKTKVPEGYTLF